MTQAPYHDPFNDPDIGIVDEEGNSIQWLSNYPEIHEDGTTTLSFMILYEGQKQLSLEVINKNVDDSTIAVIPFEAPAE